MFQTDWMTVWQTGQNNMTPIFDLGGIKMFVVYFVLWLNKYARCISSQSSKQSMYYQIRLHFQHHVWSSSSACLLSSSCLLYLSSSCPLISTSHLLLSGLPLLSSICFLLSCLLNFFSSLLLLSYSSRLLLSFSLLFLSSSSILPSSFLQQSVIFFLYIP